MISNDGTPTFYGEKKDANKENGMSDNSEWQFGGGSLDKTTLEALLNALAADITLVDENDMVKYYNQPCDRVFQREPSVIGRKVQDCHSAKTVPKVNQILSNFRQKKRSEVTFWIIYQGNSVRVMYLPLYDKEGIYRGCIEFTQKMPCFKFSAIWRTMRIGLRVLIQRRKNLSKHKHNSGA